MLSWPFRAIFDAGSSSPPGMASRRVSRTASTLATGWTTRPGRLLWSLACLEHALWHTNPHSSLTCNTPCCSDAFLTAIFRAGRMSIPVNIKLASAAGAAVTAAAPKLRLEPCVVEVPALGDVKLDGKATKLEQFLQLAPWYRPLPQQQAAFASQQDAAGAAQDDPPAPAPQPQQPGSPSRARRASDGGRSGAQGGGNAAAKAAGLPGKKKGKPKDPKVVEFSVKAAAVLVGREPPVMPASLLEWALEVRHGVHSILQRTVCMMLTDQAYGSVHEQPEVIRAALKCWRVLVMSCCRCCMTRLAETCGSCSW